MVKGEEMIAVVMIFSLVCVIVIAVCVAPKGFFDMSHEDDDD